MEQGSHADLIARPGGAYATLVGLQMSALGAKQADGQQDVLEDEMVNSLWSESSLSSIESRKQHHLGHEALTKFWSFRIDLPLTFESTHKSLKIHTCILCFVGHTSARNARHPWNAQITTGRPCHVFDLMLRVVFHVSTILNTIIASGGSS